MPAATYTARLFIELGLAIVGLAILARIARRVGFPAIPLYLAAGLAFGKGGLAPLDFSESFIRTGADIGVLLLLFMLGLEYTGEELQQNLRSGVGAGMVDFAFNFTPGVLVGVVLGWTPVACALMGGVTYISSSGVIARVLSELNRMGNPETRTVISVLVFEDLAMAVYLPLMAVVLVGGGPAKMAASVSIAMATVLIVLLIAVRYGRQLSAFASHESDEVILLTTFGAVLLVGGIAQWLQVSAAIGAFLVGIAVSGPIAKRAYRLVAPLRDLFAATFFLFFGLEIDPATLPGAAVVAVAAGILTAATKIASGYWAASWAGVDHRARMRAGAALVARGEFSIVIAGLGTAVQPEIGPVSAAYVLFLAVAGPVLARVVR